MAARSRPLQIGLLGTFQFLPFILLTIPAGVWVDRMRRRPILIGGDQEDPSPSIETSSSFASAS